MYGTSIKTRSGDWTWMRCELKRKRATKRQRRLNIQDEISWSVKECSEWKARNGIGSERGVHERTISAGVVWCGVCTVPATLCKVWGEPAPAPAPLKALWDYRPISLFHALLTILFPSSMLPTLFFRDLLKNTKHTRNMFTYEFVQQCPLHRGYSPFNNACFLVYLYCIGFRQRYRLSNVLRVISIEFVIHSSYKYYFPNIHFVRFYPKGFYVMFPCILFLHRRFEL